MFTQIYADEAPAHPRPRRPRSHGRSCRSRGRSRGQSRGQVSILQISILTYKFTGNFLLLLNFIRKITDQKQSDQGCQIFLDAIYQNDKTLTINAKLPNGHKIDQNGGNKL
jgi:hypothetical protein